MTIEKTIEKQMVPNKTNYMPLCFLSFFLICFTMLPAFNAKYINVAYYITGHGLGHATRSLELIRGLLSTEKYCIHIITTVDESFFVSELNSYNMTIKDREGVALFQHWNRNLDTGAVQRDAIFLDPRGTLDAYYTTVYRNRQKLLDYEISWAKQHSISLILMDATVLGSAIANELGIPSCFVTNFTWDFVFEEMLNYVSDEVTSQMKSEYEQMINTAKKDVSSVTHFVSYPGQTPLPPAFEMTKLIEGPLVSRPVRNKNLRQELGISDVTKVLLMGFGGHSAEFSLSDSFLPEGWICLVLRADKATMPSERFRAMPHDSYVPDLIYAADAVLGKIGYGFVSECLSAGTALIYIPRVYWPEERYLEDVLVDKYNAGVKISLDEYNRGNWHPYLFEAESKRRSWTIEYEKHPERATDIVVGHINSILDGKCVFV
jgi:L-arabinokinase